MKERRSGVVQRVGEGRGGGGTVVGAGREERRRHAARKRLRRQVRDAHDGPAVGLRNGIKLPAHRGLAC
jgi:hypothetical protein